MKPCKSGENDEGTNLCKKNPRTTKHYISPSAAKSCVPGPGLQPRSIPLLQPSKAPRKKNYRTFSFDAMMFRSTNEARGFVPSSYGAVEPSSLYTIESSYSIGRESLPNRQAATQLFVKNARETNVVKKDKEQKYDFFFYVIYALLNTMMSVPSLYGYASVIFNHVAFQPYISSLSKLVIWSSAVHQMCFVLFSSIPFSKAEVQDAGLLFLSCITQYIADMILAEDGTAEEILSTTVVALGIATTSLGSMLIFLGVFNCANVVSYLPLPVIGGYLAFIGYFCVVAGIGLCISQSMIDGTLFSDLRILSDPKSLMLAAPGVGSAIVMMLATHYGKSDAALPTVMLAIPTLFFFTLHFFGYSMDDARRNQWVGDDASNASLSILFDNFDINLVRWDIIFSLRCFTIWMGMVFLVSFSSCLDVTAISMEMGQPLNMSKELKTVGISNMISGLLLGQTGSYIFSQTILTYRTGFHSRWIGFLGVLMFLYFALSNVNLLDITPLFFLGSTLIFIGGDLLYEWIIEVSKKLLISEYLVLLATFVAIQIVGIDGGIIFGVIVAIVEYVITSSQNPSLRRVLKQSRAIWGQHHRQFIQDVVYSSRHPQIVTLEITETVFFGSALLVYYQICEEIGLDATHDELYDFALHSPRMHSFALHSSPQTQSPIYPAEQQRRIRRQSSKTSLPKHKPRFVVLEMNQVANVDASAARSCFLQLAKMCCKNGIILCVTGANSRVQWVFRSHDVSYTSDEEEVVKGMMLNPYERVNIDPSSIPSGKLVQFTTLNECLELCEYQLIYEHQQNNLLEPQRLRPNSITSSSASSEDLMYQESEEFPQKIQLSKILERILGMEDSEDKGSLKSFDEGGVVNVEEFTYGQNQTIFTVDDAADCFYVVLRGCVRICRKLPQEDETVRSISSLEREVSYVKVGQIFGYLDFALERRRSFNAVSSKFGTIVAKISRSDIDNLKKEELGLHHIIDKVLLKASLMELANLGFT